MRKNTELMIETYDRVRGNRSVVKNRKSKKIQKTVDILKKMGYTV